MTGGDEMAQAAGAASPEDALAGSLRLIDTAPCGALPPLRLEQSTPSPSGGVDRLARLARLIEQDQTLAALVRGSQLRQGLNLSPGREESPSSHLAREDMAFAHDREGESGPPSVPVGEESTGEPYVAPAYGEDDGPDYSNGLPDQPRGVRILTALIGLALAGCASAFTYWTWVDGRGRSGEPRVMAASISPEKTAPSAREHSRLDEQPHAQSDERSSEAPGPATTRAQEPADATPPTPQALPPTDMVFGPAPTKIAGLTSPTTLSSASTPQNEPSEATKPPPRQPAPAARAPSGAHDARNVVQLSSERDEAAARARSELLEAKYRKAFAGHRPFIRRADLGERGVYYRVQIGPFTIEEANNICEDLKKSGADCVVHRN
jgi:SPOR domain